MAKKGLFVLVLAAFAVGGAWAQLGFGPDAGGVSGVNAGVGFNLAPMQWGGGYDPASAAQAQGAAKAAWQNVLGGLWSWKNGDTFGGAMTAGLEGGGLALTIVGFAMLASGGGLESVGPSFAVMGVGFAVFTGGLIFGYLRGSSQYKKQNAAAAAWTGNPLDHISVAVLPANDGIAGNILFRMAF
jgi:hypothetical protein